MPRAPRSARSSPWLPAALATLLLAAGIAVGALAAPSSTAAAAEARTWVVDAVDDASGNRWESVDTGTSVVTVAVGDTVEWQFDRATQGHDLTSLAPEEPWETAWSPALEAYRDAGGEPVRHTFTEPGTYRYLCAMHGTLMSGTVVVVPEGGNQPPTAAPVVSPTSGAAPLVVHATANAADPDGDVVAVSWDFGTGAAASYTDHALFEYDLPGQYVATLRVSDGRGGLVEREFPITVTGEPTPTDPVPPTDVALPTIDALATPAPGATPRDVAFSTQVTTSGTLHSFSHGLLAYPTLTGDAVLVRRRGRTSASLDVTGGKPGAFHPVHVHERACDDQLGGAHFRFDETQPFAEANELWPAFTADATGASGPVEVARAVRAGPHAVSVVVHDPDNASRRIGCADLGPGTAELAYAWDFGDGSTEAGADPDHTYAAPGTYTATVTVTRTSGGHAGHASVSDSVQVVVGAPPIATPPTVVPPTVVTPADATAPRITRVRPLRAVGDRTPTVRARVRDRDSGVRKRSIVLRLDGRRVAGIRYDTERGLVRWTSRRRLAPGRHVVRLLAADSAGNRAVRAWRFTVLS
ncbi:MAG TPA: PKD domain-containing protein [Nocardioides sp.]|nr:PKD domain-containing protein [Nocardioides sp.]